MAKDIKEIFSKNLKKLMQSKGDNLTELSNAIDVSYSTVSDWMHGNKMARSGGLQKIAEHYKVNTSYLTTEHDFEQIDILPIYNKLNSNNQNKVYVFAEKTLEEQESKIIDMRKWKDVYVQSKVSAGTGILDLDQEHQELISYDGYVPEKYDLAFEVNGDSMEPIFRDKEIIFVKHEEEVRNGQLGVVLINEEAFIKKMYVEEDKLRLVSLNKKYDDIIANGTDEIKVIGRVII